MDGWSAGSTRVALPRRAATPSCGIRAMSAAQRCRRASTSSTSRRARRKAIRCGRYSRSRSCADDQEAIGMNLSRRMLLALVAAATMTALAACGGGGGGGPTTTVKGVILTATGDTPVSGAVVSAGGVSFTTVADGVFTLPGVPTTATQLSVTATGIKPLTQNLPALTSGATLDLGNIFVINSSDTTNSYTANIGGVVERGDTHVPVGGAQVILSGQVTTTGTDGTFHF